MGNNAIILSVGDELVLGQTVDTNSAWLSRRLAEIGVPVTAHLTVADDLGAIRAALVESAERCRTLLVSGGLGPTPDDLTRQALAEALNQPLETDASWLAELERYFAARKRPMPPVNRIQAMIPRTARMLFNPAGTAAGIEARLGACRIFVMPGVPREMNVMFEREVLPHLSAESGGAVILSASLHTFGMGESSVAETLGDLMRRDRNPSVGTTVSQGVVSLRINSRFGSESEAREEMERTVRACSAALGPLIYGRDEQTLPGVVGGMLKEAPGRPSVATAESCTGGLLGKMITDVPGSSAYYSSGWVTYSNQAKQDLLGVSAETLSRHGAVSEPVVTEMAAGAKTRSGAAYALAISGVAGPDGGTPAKPVGTVCIALASSTGIDARTFLFPGEREFVRDRSAKMALTLLRYHLLGVATPF